MRLYTALALFCGICAAAPALERDGWRRQEQGGAVAYFKGQDAMIMVVPAKPWVGELRSAYTRALGSFLGGKIVAGGDLRDAGSGALEAEYEVQEPNGTRTYRASVGWVRNGNFESLLYAANDAASFQRYRSTAADFFKDYRGNADAQPAASSKPSPAPQAPPAPAGSVSGIVGGEWYTGRVSTIQRQDSVTGRMAPPAGNNMTFKFHADGTYQQYGLMQFTYATCVNSYFMNITGRYELKGDKLTLTPLDGTYDSRTCGGQPVRKPVNKVVTTDTIRLTGDELLMTDEKGASSTYRRK
ncbi:MAG TPA: hypothetical protein VFQ91_00060 [Bryobacteraceae bacterium]|nr:hypothetical protein [Bryobacteraceae bacterium]